MSKTAILYYSAHHGNTQKIAEVIGNECKADSFKTANMDQLNPAEYDNIILASGVYMGKLHNSLTVFVDKHLKELADKKIYLIVTYGGTPKKAIQEFSDYLEEKDIKISGEFDCPGFDTYGLFKLIGGLRKKHPNEKDCNAAIDFASKMGLSLKK